MKKQILLFVLIISLFSVTYAQTNTWDGSEGVSWSEPLNWSLNHVPISSEDVVIPNVANYCYVSASGGYSASCKSLVLQAGETLRVGDATITVTNDVNIYGHLYYSYTTASLDVGGDITWHSGSTDNISQGYLYVAGDWYFNNGTSVTLTGTNTVTFDGTTSQFIYCMDSDAQFYNVVVDQTGTTALWLAMSSTQDIHVAGDLTINASNLLQVQTEALTVDGTLDVQNGGQLYLEHPGGSMVNHSDLTLNGEMNIDSAVVIVHGEFEIGAAGELTIQSGSFEYDVGSGQNGIFGTLNISGGTYRPYETIWIAPAGVVNMTGGLISANAGFQAQYTGNFQPTGGIVELEHTYSGFSTMEFTNGNYLVDVKVDCSHENGGVYLNSDVLIQNDLEILDGTVELDGYSLEVQNDVDVYGDLALHVSGDELTVGNDILFHSGSQTWSFGGISIGTIYVAGDWYFNNGTSAQLTGTNTVIFNGSTSQFIYCMDADAQFNNVVIDKTGTLATWLHTSSTHDIHVAGDLTIYPSNTLQVETEDLTVDGVIDVQNTGRLMLEDVGGSLVSNSTFVINGEMTIAGGDAEVFGNFQVYASGVLSMMDGAFTIHNTNYTTSINGEMNLSSTAELIVFGDFAASIGSDVNISGGQLKVGQSINALSDNVFQPSGGVVELFGSNQCFIIVMGSIGNYFQDLIINKDEAVPVLLINDAQVNNDLSIVQGYLDMNSYTMSIAGDVDVYDRLVMTDNSDSLHVEGDIQWYSGSTDDVTNGGIAVEGNWIFNSSTQCDLSTPASTNTVYFIGPGISVITSNGASGAFNNVTINKTTYPTNTVTVTGSVPLDINGILTIDDGELILDTDVNAGGL